MEKLTEQQVDKIIETVFGAPANELAAVVDADDLKLFAIALGAMDAE